MSVRKRRRTDKTQREKRQRNTLMAASREATICAIRHTKN